MRLTVFRHGIAIDRADPDCPSESERALTSKGIKRTRDAAKGLRVLGVKADLFISSPYLRASQTARLAAKALGIKKKSIRESEALLPSADPYEILEELERLEAEDVVCVGHAPHLDLLIAEAIGSPDGLPLYLGKAGAAQVEWGKGSPRRGILSWVMTPRSLRQLSGSRCGKCPHL